MALTARQLTGRDDAHIAYDARGVGLTPACGAAFARLRRAAGGAGFDLQAASGFRSFERQLAIWNAKARGERAVLDDSGAALTLEAMPPAERVHAILRYSALPGASRHHWGSDVDVYDAAAMPEDYRVELTPQEAADDGVFGPLHRWLDEAIAAGKAEGFYRPYAQDGGGTAPERWHLSYAPEARPNEQAFREPLLRECLAGAELALGDAVLAQLPDLCRRYFAASSPV